MNKTAIDLTDAQLRYLRGVLLIELVDNQKRVRNGVQAEGPEDPDYMNQLQDDIRIASALIAILPEPRREGV